MVANLRVEEWHSVHQRLRSIAKRRAELDAEEARWLREAERIQLWRRLGYIHMGEYLERELGYTPHLGAERLRVARALAELPQIEAALGEGVLNYSAVRELSRIATRETEAEWLATARGKNVRQVESAVSGRKRGDRPEDPTRPELVSRIVRFELLPEVFALLRQTQAVLADEHGGRLDDNAFVEALCRRAVEGFGAVEDARPAHQISITVCESCKRGWQNGAGREIEVGPAVIERAQCDAEHIGSLEAAQPARVTATVTPRLRRQVLARDHHCCTVPGCRSARNLDLHHIQYQSDGGGNEIGNLTVLCSGHHHQLHEGALTIRGRAPDGLEFTWSALVAPAVSAIEQSQSQGGAEVGRLVLGVVAPGVIVEPVQRHEGAEARRHMPGMVEPGVIVEPVQSHGGRENTPRERDVSKSSVPVEEAPSYGGRENTPRERNVSKSSVPVEEVPSYGGPEPTPRERDGSKSGVTVEPVRSHGGPVAALHEPRFTADANPLERARFGREPAQSHVGRDRARRPAGERAASSDDDIARDVCSALITAGYKSHVARRAVDDARSHVGPGATLEQLLREALRCCVR